MSAGVANATTGVFLNSAATPPSLIGAAKSVTSLVFEKNSQYVVTYRVLIKNMGITKLTDIQATDDLRGPFIWSPSFAVQDIRSNDLTPNPAYDGKQDTNLLMGDDTLDVGESGTVEFDVLFTTYRYSLDARNSAFVSANNDSVRDVSTNGTNPDPDNDGDPHDNDTPTPLTPGGAIHDPLMEATMYANSDDVTPGEEIRYTINIENSGVGSATDVIVTTTPDAHTRLIHDSVRTNRGTVVTGDEAGDTQVEVRISSIPANQFARITFNVRVKEGVLPVGTHILSAQGQISGNNFEDLLTDDDPDTEEVDEPTMSEVRVEQLPLQATMSDTFVASDSPASSVQAGSLITYTTVVENQGDVDTAEDVVFSVTPDANTEMLYESLQTSQGSFAAGLGADDTQIVAEVGDIAASEAVTINFTVRVREGVFPVGNHTLNLQGDVTSSNFLSIKTDDPDTSAENDATETEVNITSFPLRVTLSDTHIDLDPEDGVVRPGDQISYTAIVTHQGSTTAENVVFRMTPDSRMVLDRESLQTGQGEFTAGADEDDTEIIVNIGNLDPGSTVTISFNVRISTEGFAQGATTLTNQGTLISSNFLDILTDDPGTPDQSDATSTIISNIGFAGEQIYLPLLIR
jgi:uncharacterized repeat protein (TIGR01451 family)